MDVAPRDDPALEVVIDFRELLAHLVAKLGTEQTAARGEVGQHPEECGRFDFALFAPTLDHIGRLARDDLRVGAHPIVAECRVQHVHLLRHARGLGAIGHALSEDWNHHLVRCVWAQHFIGESEQRLVCFGTREENHVLSEQLEAPDRAALVMRSLQQAYRIFHERHGVPDEREPTFELGWPFDLPCTERGGACLGSCCHCLLLKRLRRMWSSIRLLRASGSSTMPDSTQADMKTCCMATISLADRIASPSCASPSSMAC